MKFICNHCGYEYDPEVGDIDSGIESGTEFDDLPKNWVCPLCGAEKDEFDSVSTEIKDDE